MEGLLRVQYGGQLGSVGNGTDLFVAGAPPAVSCAVVFVQVLYRGVQIMVDLPRCYSCVVVRQENVVAGEPHTCVCHHIPCPDA